MHRLKFGIDDTKRATFLVREHMSFASSMGTKGYRRLIARCHDAGPDRLEDLLKIYRADSFGMIDEKMAMCEEVITNIEGVLTYFGQENEKIESPISGDLIMNVLNISQGKTIGIIKDFLTQKVVDGELAQDDGEKAVKLVREFYANM